MCFVCITALWLLLLFSIVLFSPGIKRKYFNNRCGSISEIILQWTFFACASYYLERARVCWFFQSYSEVPQTPLCTTAIMNEDVEMLTEAQVSVSPTFTHKVSLFYSWQCCRQQNSLYKTSCCLGFIWWLRLPLLHETTSNHVKLKNLN